MSKMSKKNKLNKKTRKNYKIESLEPRLLMDASSDESLRAWTEELATVTASDLQNALKDSSSIIVDGLLRANENGDMERVDMKGLADLDKVYDWQNKEKDLNDFLKKQKRFGLVWEDKPENVVRECETKLPVLKEVDGKAIEKAEGVGEQGEFRVSFWPN